MRLLNLAVLAGVVCLAFPATAQEAENEQDAAMAAWTAAAQPGEIHTFFATLEGNWKLRTKMWMAPGADAIESEATAEAQMILGGRYLQEKVKGMSMGGPFEGMSIMGYDNTTGVVTAVWWDTMGTMTSIVTGEYCAPGEPLELTGTMTDAASGGEIAVRTVSTFVSEDEHHFDYYMAMPGMEEMKGMAMIYTRVK